MSDTCTNCGKLSKITDGSVWWSLTNYNKIWGYFCSDCYELVSHDSLGNPKHYNEWHSIAVMQQLTKKEINYE